MAVASQIEIHEGEDGVVAVRRDVIVDPELGIAAEVEKVVAAVDVGGGKVALLEKTQVTGVKAIPNRGEQRPAITNKPAAQAQPNPPPARPSAAATTGTSGAGSGATVTTTPARTSTGAARSRRSGLGYRLRRTVSSSSIEWDELDKYCIKSKVVGTCSTVLFLVGAAIVGLAAAFLLPCSPLKSGGAAVVTSGCLTVVISCLYCTFLCKKRGSRAVCRCICLGLMLAAFLGVTIAISIFVFQDYSSKKESSKDSTSCQEATIVIAIVTASVSYAVLVVACIFSCAHAIAMYKDR